MRKLFILTLAAAAVFSTSACNKYDNVLESSAVRRNSEVMPPKSVSDQMPSDKLQVPSDARDVSWDREGQYWELSYETGYGADKIEVEVYFDSDGDWVMTKTDVRMKNVPSYIKEYVASSAEYAGAVFSDRDADFIERPSGNSYQLEVILGHAEIDLEVSEDGEITEIR
jgi:hypothetical protein